MRVLHDPPADGAANMQRDEALLVEAIAGGEATLRWYRWSEPTLSLGYSQSDDPDIHPELPRVRRLSGGGAILHDDEWTYSLTLPRSHPHAVQPGRLYRLVHQAICETASGYGVEIAFRQSAEKELDGAFLCFARGDANDLMTFRKTKVVGSAQRRRRGAVLQHGSLLWRAGQNFDPQVGFADINPDLNSPQTAAAFRDGITDRVAFSLRKQAN